MPTLRARVLKAVRAALNRSAARKVKVIGDETSRVIEQAVPEDPVSLTQEAHAALLTDERLQCAGLIMDIALALAAGRSIEPFQHRHTRLRLRIGR